MDFNVTNLLFPKFHIYSISFDELEENLNGNAMNRISDLVFREPFMYNYFQNEGLAANYK